MIRRFAVLAIVLSLSAAVSAQADVSGEWAVAFATPQGPAEFTMYVNQAGPRLTGRLTSDAGEFPLRGTVDGSQFTIVWSLPDQGRLVEVTFKGTVTGDHLAGTARLGTAGEGAMSAERTGR
jgi:hypothetical protein